MKVSTYKLKQSIKGLIISVMRSVIKQRQIKAVALFILTKVPKTKAYLNNIALSAGLSTKHNEVTVAEINNVVGSVSLANTQVSKVTDIDYFEYNISQKLCQVYALNFDFELIEKIRRDKPVDYFAYAGDKLKITIVHFYLALLYRYPTTTEIKQSSDRVIHNSNFESLMKKILDSAEYTERGCKEVIS